MNTVFHFQSNVWTPYSRLSMKNLKMQHFEKKTKKSVKIKIEIAKIKNLLCTKCLHVFIIVVFNCIFNN